MAWWWPQKKEQGHAVRTARSLQVHKIESECRSFEEAGSNLPVYRTLSARLGNLLNLIYLINKYTHTTAPRSIRVSSGALLLLHSAIAFYSIASLMISSWMWLGGECGRRTGGDHLRFAPGFRVSPRECLTRRVWMYILLDGISRGAEGRERERGKWLLFWAALCELCRRFALFARMIGSAFGLMCADTFIAVPPAINQRWRSVSTFPYEDGKRLDWIKMTTYDEDKLAIIWNHSKVWFTLYKLYFF
jgi:hypothetical protein